jgi:nitrite reductase (NADH) large subunit
MSRTASLHRAGHRPLRTIPAGAAPAWQAIQLAGLVAVVALIGGLLLRPVPSLHLLWDMVIPLLPAVFLVNPLIWRNVCPVATLNAYAGEVSRGDRRFGAGLRAAWGGGIILLLLLVPARHAVFNENGALLALLIAALAGAAISTGLVYDRRAGFCSALCPVLPVEKLYGQFPLLSVGSARCGDCSLCVAAGCPDLARGKAAAQTVPDRSRWMLTAFGAFAAMFPGIIAGYFTFEAGVDNPFLHLGLAAVGSWICASIIADALRFEARDALPVLGAVSFATYYWWAAPKLAVAYDVDAAAIPLRWVAVILAGLWLWRALRLSGPQATRTPLPLATSLPA